MPRRLKHRSGFTLIELLVTITIIAVLATLSGAAYTKVMAYSKRTACISNLRQWGGALQLYIGEHNGQLPRRGQGVRMVGQFNRPDDWFNALPPYMGMDSLQTLMSEGRAPKPGDKSVFACPAAMKGQAGAITFLSYGMNMYLSQWNQPLPDNINDIQSPGQLVFMADSPGGYASTIPSGAAYSVPARHDGHACVVFCDGHAHAFRGDYVGCNAGALTHDDIRWLVTPDSANGTPVR
jgi:prepilin-type N-terminal cleavage/methylation domain-containing protein